MSISFLTSQAIVAHQGLAELHRQFDELLEQGKHMQALTVLQVIQEMTSVYEESSELFCKTV